MGNVEKLPEVTDEEWKEINDINREIAEEWLTQGHLSDKTLQQYKSAIRQFFKWVMDKCNNKPIYQLKPRDALRYQNFLIERGLSSSAIKFKRSAVSSFCGYIEIYYSDEDEFRNFRNIYNKNIPSPPKVAAREKDPLTPEEFEQLVDELEKRNERQMLAYLWFSYITGCRRAEALQLKKEVADYKKVKDKNYYLTHEIRTKGRGKVGKVRRLKFDERAMLEIRKWLDERGDDDCEYVFVKKTKEGKTTQLGETTFNYWCESIFSAIVGKRVHPHLLRSSRATNLAREETDIKAIQKLLGHESSETTSIYIIYEDEEDDDIF